MSGTVHGNSIQAGRIESLIIGPQPPPWRKWLVVAVVVLLLGVFAVVVAVVLDGSGKHDGISSNSTSTGIPPTSGIVPESTEPESPTSTKNTTASPKYKVDGPVRTGEVELSSQTSYDLDLDRQAFSDEGGDVVLDCCALNVFSDAGMSFPRGDQPADCLGQPTRQNVVVEDLREHPTLCVITDRGGLATVHATLVSAPLETFQRVKITFELWTVSR